MNPFAKKDTSPPVKLSAWERLDARYRHACEQIAGKKLSPQNKRVRAAADRYCRERGIPTK